MHILYLAQLFFFAIILVQNIIKVVSLNYISIPKKRVHPVWFHCNLPLEKGVIA
jgi:hypothetical protein